jgi:hypothetical protein
MEILCKEFVQVIDLIGKLRQELDIPSGIKLVLITNGSLMHRAYVQEGLSRMALHNGEVWFKLDRASAEGMQLVNNTQMNMQKVRENLLTAIGLCPTWLQTCWFAIDGNAPSAQDEDSYLNFIGSLLSNDIKLQGILLYTIARPSLQIEAPRLTALSALQMESFAERIRSLGMVVKVST